MRAEGQRVCKVCGTLVPETSDACPVCVLRGALTPEDDSHPSSVDPNLSELCFEHYQVLKGEDGTPTELGRGAMGVTYKALDVNLRFAVTLKVINAQLIGDESARQRFVREARAAASVRHPNVASVFHLGKRGDSYFYAMEFVEGETLESLIRRSGRLDVELALEIAAQVAAGLAAVHKQNLVHRDIKPSNVMVNTEEGAAVTAKIIDLGLAKSLDEPGTQTAISTPGSFAGTPEFASPEQFGGVPVDIRSDLYSLGVTLWEMLVGQVPFRGTPGEVMHQHQHAPLPLEQLERVPQPVVVLLEVLLEKDPARRFQNPGELLKAIPVVMRAVKARRTINHQNLRSAFVQVFPTPKKLPAIRAPKRSIAVLPFDTLSHAKGNTYFADGVQDEILSNLAKVSQLKVISRTSVMAFRPGENRNLRSIAESLGVANVVEGTVRRDGKHVRLTIRLVDARTDKALWSESYDRDLIDVFAIQSEIAQTVATKLTARLSPEERKAIEAKPTEDLEAYDLYLQAKQLVTDTPGVRLLDERENLSNAVKLLQAAVAKDSQFVLAYCLLVKAYDQLYRLDLADGLRVLGDAALKEAMYLQPDLPDVHIASAFHLYRCYRDYPRARLKIAMAQRVRPNSTDALAIAAYIDREQGRLQESTRCLEQAIELDPRNSEYVRQLATNYVCLNRIQQFEHIYERIIRIFPEERSFLCLERAFFRLTAKGDLTSCREALAELPVSLRDDRRIVSQRFAYALHGRDWRKAKEILTDTSNKDLYFSEAEALVPRDCLWIWLAQVQGNNSRAKTDFAAGREALFQRAKEHPKDPALLSALGLIDAALGRKEDAIGEARCAVEMLPISADAWFGPTLMYNLAAVYAVLNEPNLAIEQLTILAEVPGAIAYGELKLDPAWDPIRKDLRFEKLLAQLAPGQSLPKPPSSASRVRTNKRPMRSGPKKISVARLPVTGSDLFGREEDIAFLDRAWANKDINIATIVAWAGVGKSTLINHWLRRMAADHYRSADLVFGWSFYRQGTSGETASADEFLDGALRWFGDPDPRLGTAWEKGERLAKLVAHRRTLLILDGLEPLQNPPGPHEGRLRGPALQALLRELAAFNKGLCVITTRTSIVDIADQERTSALRRDLEQLSSEDGAKLLGALGVKGDELDLRTASDEFGGHCLALTLLGSYLTDAFNGDIRFRKEISDRLAHDIRQGVQARKVMESYQKWFGEGPELAVLRMLGLFDRPADEKAIAALLESPVIPGLTECLTDLSQIARWTIIAKLRRARLLAAEDPNNPGQLDAHPLVRQYFGEQLRTQTSTWTECNRRLYNYYRALAPELPQTLREMEPLFLGVICGCNAGLYREALHEVYMSRIQRGDASFAAKVLGARGALLAVLAHFFEEGRWGSLAKTIVDGEKLVAEDQVYVLMQAALHLTATRDWSAEARTCWEHMESLCRSLNRPRLLYVALMGQWYHSGVTDTMSATIEIAQRVNSLAQKEGDPALIMGAYRALADPLYFSGDFESARDYAIRAIQIWRSEVQSPVEEVDVPAVTCLTTKALCEWHFGEIDCSKTTIVEAISLARELNDMPALALAILTAGILARLENIPSEVETFALELVELSLRYGFGPWLPLGSAHLGWARAVSGDVPRGLSCIEGAIQDYRQRGSVLALPYLLALKAEVLHLAGRSSEALTAINEAEAVSDRTGVRDWSSELQRLRGVFLAAMHADPNQVKDSFDRAVSTARKQKSISLEKRAEATSAEYFRRKANSPR